MTKLPQYYWILTASALLTGCVNIDDQFFETKNRQIGEGYEWTLLPECRHKLRDVPAISVKGLDWGDWVCYKLTRANRNRDFAKVSAEQFKNTSIINEEISPIIENQNSVSWVFD